MYHDRLVFIAATYRNQSILILGFVKDDDRRRLDGNEFSELEMDNIRRKIGLPAGTKPRWYELNGMGYDPNEELQSEDERFPDDTGEKTEIYESVPDVPDLMLDLW
ncbi:uncharacterized protein FOMMEDRAFT_142655 [Fomitiporia mediterranea MF3/22]|uniref:uncharacterized protein n=1 Tax=Fomitiporia mediterranea (strain MF3/22) TaxID=694068 RepID=UPI0004407871|nr:uncharacterized protein FOMMEDRAFT_142655 [Fomitiporia mediterranea MF3/22]EJC99672.1 hypothetical protein FOMMEDRAFT_142655 [Fomitiporia mediterranea MF3/22]